MQLATAEIYMTIAVIVRRFKLKQRMFEKIEHKDFFGLVIENPITVVLAATDD